MQSHLQIVCIYIYKIKILLKCLYFIYVINIYYTLYIGRIKVKVLLKIEFNNI